MSRTKALEKVKLTRFDDLFGGKEEPVVEAGEVKQIPISELHEFHNHPFQIRSDEELEEYLKRKDAVGVSLTLPLRREPYETTILFPFFDGLIPEGWLLGVVCRNWKIDRNDRFGLLLSACKDCIGDVCIKGENE